MGKSKKNNPSTAHAVPPSKQNPVGSFDRSPSPSSEDFEKVENTTNSDDTTNWSKVGSAADSGTDESQQQSFPTTLTVDTTIYTTESTTKTTRKSHEQVSSDSETDQARDEKKRTSSSKEKQLIISKMPDYDNVENKTLIYERISKLRDNAPRTRKELYQSTYTIFEKLENIGNKKRVSALPYSYSIGSTRKSTIGKCVKEYTSLLFQYLEWLNQNDGEKAEKIYTCDLLRIWDLCERLNFTGNEDDAVVSDMVDWLNLHWPSEEASTSDLKRFQSFDSDDEELVIVDHDDISNRSGDDDLEESKTIPVDWMLIRRNLLRGNIIESIQMLKASIDSLSADNQGCLRRVIKLAEAMPPLPYGNNHDLTSWQEWKAMRRQVIDEFKGFISSSSTTTEQDPASTDRRVRKEINSVLRILCGDEKMISKAGTFLESFVGTLIFSEPFRARTDTASIAERIISLLPADQQTEEDVVVAACHSILLRDWDGALSVFDDCYLQTHIGHTLICAGIMPQGGGNVPPSIDHEACINPVYHIMNVYAKLIAHEQDMWDEAMGYISTCSSNREFWAKELLNERIASAQNTKDLDTMIQICEKHQFLSLKKLLCKVLAEKYEQEGNTQDATINYARAEDIASLDKLADKALKQYLDKGILEQIVTETNETRDAIEKSTHYKFFLQYHRLCGFLETKQYNVAADLIKQMLKSINAPAEFQAILLIDSMSILEESSNQTMMFNEKETLDLMRQLQQTRDSMHENVFTQCYSRVRLTTDANMDDKKVIFKISQSLAFNLANALIA